VVLNSETGDLLIMLRRWAALPSERTEESERSQFLAAMLAARRGQLREMARGMRDWRRVVILVDDATGDVVWVPEPPLTREAERAAVDEVERRLGAQPLTVGEGA
jgi:hypothetical protein